MTMPKNVDNLDEEKFKRLIKKLSLQPQYINNKMVETYAIERNGKLYGYINKKKFEYIINKL